MSEPEPVSGLYPGLVCPDHRDQGLYTCPLHPTAADLRAVLVDREDDPDAPYLPSSRSRLSAPDGDGPAAETHSTFPDPVIAVALWAITAALTLAAIDTSYKYGTPVPFLVYLAITAVAVPAAVFWIRARKANR